MGNKEQKLEMCTHLRSYDIIGIMEAWWDSSHDWTIDVGEYRLFRKDRQGRRGGGVTLYVKDHLECMELHLGLDEEPKVSLFVKTKCRVGTGDITVGVCYRPPDQDERADKAFYR